MSPPNFSIPWLKLLLLAAVIGFFASGGLGKLRGTAAGGVSYDQAAVRAVAATVAAGDVVMYTTTECGYCAQAKQWLAQNNFAYTECNMTVDSGCIAEFNRYGANGTPFLVVRGKEMHDGFDTDQFLKILQQPPT